MADQRVEGAQVQRIDQRGDRQRGAAKAVRTASRPTKLRPYRAGPATAWNRQSSAMKVVNASMS
jgi:hypothetical protein